MEKSSTSEGGDGAGDVVIPRKRRRTGEKEQRTRHVLPVECIICKKSKWIQPPYGPRKKEPLTNCEYEKGGQLLKAAELLNDESILLDIQGQDMVAIEVRYHRSCHKNYIKVLQASDWRSSRESEKESESQVYKTFCSKYIEEKIISEGSVMRMTKLLHLLRQMSEEAGVPPFISSTTMLREKLKRRYPQLLFQRPLRMNIGGIVYCEGKEASIVEQWESSHSSETEGSDDPGGPTTSRASLYSDEAWNNLYLSAITVKEAVSSTKGLKGIWPPRSQDLGMDRIHEMIPAELFNFIAWTTGASSIVSKGWMVDTTDEHKRKILSICQDIIYMSSRGRVPMPKHVALGMTMRHLTGSSHIIGLLNGLGHSVSHSAVLEHDTALAALQNTRDSLIPDGFVKSTPTILVWDNNDFKEETPSGHGTTHNTNGVIIQRDSQGSEPLTSASVRKTKQRSVDPPSLDIEAFQSGKRQGPHIPDTDTTVAITAIQKVSLRMDLAYCLTKLPESDTALPGWTGFNTLVSSLTVPEKSRVGYLPIIDASPTEMATVYTILKRSVAIADRLDLDAIAVIFDQAIYAKAQQIRWQTPVFQKRLVIRLGQFHTCMSLLACIGKRFQDSGFEDIIIESELVAAGSLNGVLTGHHYNRGLHTHKILYEALQQMRWKSFLQTLDPEHHTKAIEVTSLLCSVGPTPAFKEFLERDDIVNILDMYDAYVLRQRAEMPMFDFWSSYIDMVEQLLMFIRATRLGDWSLHMATLKTIVPWYFAYGRTNYARYLPGYIAEMLELPSTHPLVYHSFLAGNWVVQRSSHAFSQVACDMTIEQTMNRDSKTKGGMIGITQKKGAVNRWILAHPDRAAISESCRVMAGKDDSLQKRKDLQQTRMKKDCGAVQKIRSTVEAMLDPFTYDRQHLIHLASGIVLPDEINVDILKAYSTGVEAYKSFVSERILTGAGFFQPVKTLRLKTFASRQKKLVTTKASGDLISLRASTELFNRLLVVSKQRKIDLRELLCHSLTPVPASLGTMDGINVKTDKSALMRAIEREIPEALVDAFPRVSAGDSALIVDGMAIIHAQTRLPNTFLEYADRLLRIVVSIAKSMHCTRVDFVMDRYPAVSIKNCEHNRRAAAGVQSLRILRPDQPLPKQMKKFLASGENKEALQEFIFESWSRPETQIPFGMDIFVCHGELCHRLQLQDNVVAVESVDELATDHEEADTRLLLHAHHASKTYSTVVVRSPDTDVFVLCLANAIQMQGCKLFMATGTAMTARILDITTMARKYGEEVSRAILGLHVFTGCDSVSAFKGKGKVKPFRQMLGSQDAVNIFKRLGVDWKPSPDLLQGIEEFVCSLYGQKTININEARYNVFTLLCRMDEGLPPNKDALQLHTARASYQAAVYRRCLEVRVQPPSPVGHGWEMEGDNLAFHWTSSPIAPATILQNISCKCKKGHCKSRICSCVAGDLPCTDLCRCSDCENTTTEDIECLSSDDEESDIEDDE